MNGIVQFLLVSTLLFSPASHPSKIIEQPRFIELRNFGFGQLSMKQSIVTADMFFFNPNSFQLQLKKIDLDIYFDSRYAGKTILDTLIYVPAKDTFSVPVDILVDMKNLFPNILSIVTKEEIGLKVEGKVRVGRSGIFINVPVKYAGMQPIRIQKRKPPVVNPGDSTFIDSTVVRR